MATKKTPKAKPLTQVQKLQRKIENLEYAIWQHYQDTDEFFAQLNVLKVYLQSDDFNKYVAKNYVKLKDDNDYAMSLLALTDVLTKMEGGFARHTRRHEGLCDFVLEQIGRAHV